MTSSIRPPAMIAQDMDEIASWRNSPNQLADLAAELAAAIREYEPANERPRLWGEYAPYLRWQRPEDRAAHRTTRRADRRQRTAGRRNRKRPEHDNRPRPERRRGPEGPKLKDWQRAVTGIDGEGWGYELDPEELEIVLAQDTPDLWPELARYITGRGGMRLPAGMVDTYRHLRLHRVRDGIPADVLAAEMPAECPAAAGLWAPEDGTEAMLEALHAAHAEHRRRPRSAGTVRWRGRQVYRLLVAVTVYPSGRVRRHRLYNPDRSRLRTEQILEWICCLPQPGQIVGFSLGYDWAHWLMDLSPEQLSALTAHETVMYEAPSSEARYELKLFPHKLLVIVKKRAPSGIEYSKYVQIFDAFPWYQCSFVKALEKTIAIPAEQRELIVAGKLRRGSDDDEHDIDEESRYAAAEMDALARMQRHLYQLCHNAGYDLERFMGPGSLAEKILAEHGVREHLVTVPEEVAHDLPYAHFGGRFEDAALGQFQRLFAYDLSSAYPWAASQLPSFVGATWERVSTWQPGELGFYHVRFRAAPRPRGGQREYWGPFPVRDRLQRISWPVAGETWVWSPELEAAHGYWPFRVLEGWRVRLAADTRPLAFLVRLYARRRELKAAGDPLENVFRLGPNSLYGKLGQIVGQSRFRFVPWASLITSMTRARLLEAIRLAGPNMIVGTATDAIYSRKPLELPSVGLGGLGDWEGPKHLPGVLVVGSGFMRSHTTPEADLAATNYERTRGLRPFEVPWPELRDRWRAMWEWGIPLGGVETTVRRFVTIMLGLLWGHPEMIGSWIEQKREIRYASDKSPEWVRGRRGRVRLARAMWLRQRRQWPREPVPYNALLKSWEHRVADAADDGTEG